jgi:hypothetical protein
MQAYPKATAMDPQHIKESSAHGVAAPMEKFDALTSTQLPFNWLPLKQSSSSGVKETAAIFDHQSLSSSSSSRSSTDSGVSFLTEENLRKLQEQITPKPYTMPARKNTPYTSTDYPWALTERGCNFIRLSEKPAPSNYTDIKTKIEAARPDDLTAEEAAKLWNAMTSTQAEDLVALVINSHILSCVSMRQPGQDLWMNLTGAWSNGFPLPTKVPTADFNIAAPSPDATIGYNAKVIAGTAAAREYLKDQCSPIKSGKQLVYPVVTVEVKGGGNVASAQVQNRHNSAVMLRNLRTLREKAGSSAQDLKTKFDGIARVITIAFTQSEIMICCCWTEMDTTGFLQFYSKPVAKVGTCSDGPEEFHAMTRKIRNAVDWATDHNKQQIRDDLVALEARVDTLTPLVPAPSVVPSTVDGED